MHYLGVEDGQAIVEHDGDVQRLPVEKWAHPTLPNGEEDPRYLVSPPIEAGDGTHVITVPLTGGAAAQALHMAAHPGEHQRLRRLVQAEGATWHLGTNGEVPSMRGEPPPGVPIGEASDGE
jgi:hypothetical protein